MSASDCLSWRRLKRQMRQLVSESSMAEAVLQGVPSFWCNPQHFSLLMNSASGTHTHTLITLLCRFDVEETHLPVCFKSLINSVQPIKVIGICPTPIISLDENVIYLERRCEAARYDSFSKRLNESKTTGLRSLSPSLDQLETARARTDERRCCDKAVWQG